MDEIAKGIGKICINFESLTLCLRALVGRLFTLDSKVAGIITSEMSFKNLVHALSSLVQYKYPNNSSINNDLIAIIQLLNKSEELRNTIIHSTCLLPDDSTSDYRRLKITSKQKAGLRTTVNLLDEDSLKQDLLIIASAIKKAHQFFQVLFPGESITLA